MKLIIKTIFFAIAMTMALTLLLTTKNISDDYKNGSPKPGFYPTRPVFTQRKPITEKRVSRFLQQRGRGRGNENAADHCHKDEEICSYIMQGRNTTCCNNKCVDLHEDDKHCGGCKNKCPATHSCCGGKCVDLAYDKRHCGSCYDKCMPGGYCIFGLCDYA